VTLSRPADAADPASPPPTDPPDDDGSARQLAARRAQRPRVIDTRGDLDPRWLLLGLVVLLTMVFVYRVGAAARAPLAEPLSATTLRAAIERYQRQTGHLPQRMDELVAAGLVPQPAVVQPAVEPGAARAATGSPPAGAQRPTSLGDPTAAGREAAPAVTRVPTEPRAGSGASTTPVAAATNAGPNPPQIPNPGPTLHQP
jgi:hypothetical protein